MDTAPNSARVSMLRLQDRHALLTGAGRGIGAAVLAAYLREGALCSAVDLSTEPSQEVQALMAQYPDRLHYITANVTQSADISRLVEQACERFGSIHIL